MECGACTACCFALDIDEIAKPKNVLCQHCDGGCSVHDNKPVSCSDFKCAYYEAKNVKESLRPDNCGVIFIRHSDTLFKAIVIPDKQVKPSAHGQIEAFNAQGFEVECGYL